MFTGAVAAKTHLDHCDVVMFWVLFFCFVVGCFGAVYFCLFCVFCCWFAWWISLWKVKFVGLFVSFGGLGG